VLENNSMIDRTRVTLPNNKLFSGLATLEFYLL